MLEIPIEKLAGLIFEICLLFLAAVGIHLGRKNKTDLNGASASLRKEINDLSNRLEKTQRQLDQARGEKASMTYLYAECAKEREKLREFVSSLEVKNKSLRGKK